MLAACLVFNAYLIAQSPTRQSQTTQQAVPPRQGAGYLLPDGTVRIVGAASMAGVISQLDSLYVREHPGTRFSYVSADNNGAIDALIFDGTPFAPIGTVYNGGLAYSDIVKAPPFAIRIAHGSLSPTAQVSPLGVIVNPANPVSRLSLGDVASIFSKPLRARVFATWAQAGVQGDFGAHPVEPAGLPWSDHYASEDRTFGDDVFYRKFAGAAPVDSYRTFKTYAEVVDFVAHTPDAIGVCALNRITSGVKLIGLTDGPFSTVHTGSAADISGGHYPIDRYLYLQVRVLGGKQLDPLVREYLKLALSPAGQAAIASGEEHYLPLSPTELAEEQGKLE